MSSLSRLTLRIAVTVVALTFISDFSPGQSDDLTVQSDDLHNKSPSYLIKELRAAINSNDGEREYAVRRAITSQSKKVTRTLVEALVEALKDRDPATRFAAVSVSEEIGPPIGEVVPHLIEIAQKDPFLKIRIEALESLSVVGIEKADDVLPIVNNGIHDDDPRVRQSAILSLRNLGILAESSTALLTDAIADPDESSTNKVFAIDALVTVSPESDAVLNCLIRYLDDEDLCSAALDALASIGPNAKPAVPKIIELLRNEPFHNINQKAAQTLGSLGPAATIAVPQLIEAMKDHNHIVCGNSAKSLGWIGMTQSGVTLNEIIGSLTASVEDDQSQCATEAAEALGMIGKQARDAIPVLIRELRMEQNPARWKSYAAGLGSIGISSEQVLTALMSAIERKPDKEGFARREAVRSLGKLDINNSEARVLLVKLLKHPDVLVRLEAASALATRKQDDKEALDVLIKMLQYPDDNTAIREYAAQSLGKMGPRAHTAVPKLLTALRQEDVYLQIHAIRALGKINTNNHAVKEELKRLLVNDNEFVRFYSAEALVQLGEIDSGVISELAWHVRNGSHRLKAVIALKQCGAKAKSILPDLEIALKSATSLDFRKSVIEASDVIKNSPTE